MTGEPKKKNQNAHAATNATASTIRTLFSEIEFSGGCEPGLVEVTIAINVTHLHVTASAEFCY